MGFLLEISNHIALDMFLLLAEKLHQVQILVNQEILYPLVMSDEDFLCQRQM